MSELTFLPVFLEKIVKTRKVYREESKNQCNFELPDYFIQLSIVQSCVNATIKYHSLFLLLTNMFLRHRSKDHMQKFLEDVEDLVKLGINQLLRHILNDLYLIAMPK